MSGQTALLQLGKLLRASGYTFVTPTPITHQRVNDRAGNAIGSTLRDAFGWNRPFAQGLLPRQEESELIESGVLERDHEQLKSTVRWSSLDNLLLVHSAFPTTQEDSVFFGPDTYRFAQTINRHLQTTDCAIKCAVDIGCGTGAGAMLIAQAKPQAEVFAVDINPKALEFTAINAKLAGLNNVVCHASNVLNDVEGRFDLIVANPPYMKDSRQRAYRHGGDALGADLSVRIVHESIERLAVGGSLLLYTGVAIVDVQDPFLASVKEALDQPALDWSYRELDPDVFGEELLEAGYEQVDRIAAVELIVTRRLPV
ncbi:methyltransferase [Pseudomonas nunensis]|uniref:Class I SAM-dependent methyltransferase n=1 Tax=Pseudomonas nunensis TaxID=2961896 RepID=A0ABY5EQK6_9PSED|nr:class I SAM-dependent methyltransferase [Pseudomonas nunensis]KPN91388.1 SAM-dependent methyltransferase [Pseudomonas nunensis]MCL5229943.1 class I SAM-dependent methyltransferase [Pseudomonas nunensis]UTO17666.1 class I SAM-dependent methyltransferase [Pseudomonas nunensis]